MNDPVGKVYGIWESESEDGKGFWVNYVSLSDIPEDEEGKEVYELSAILKGTLTISKKVKELK